DDANILSFNGYFFEGVDDIVRVAVENQHTNFPGRNKLVVIVTSGGGYIEVVHRIVETFRRYYRLVDLIGPNQAYSARTVLVMSGDAILMDYYSRLGPIDPQLETISGRLVSALGYLERNNDLLKKGAKGQLTTAEMEILLAFDQGE